MASHRTKGELTRLLKSPDIVVPRGTRAEFDVAKTPLSGGDTGEGSVYRSRSLRCEKRLREGRGLAWSIFALVAGQWWGKRQREALKRSQSFCYSRGQVTSSVKLLHSAYFFGSAVPVQLAYCPV